MPPVPRTRRANRPPVGALPRASHHRIPKTFATVPGHYRAANAGSVVGEADRSGGVRRDMVRGQLAKAPPFEYCLEGFDRLPVSGG
jgi:hypothetical protein